MKENQAWSEYCKALSPAIIETCTRTSVAAGPSALVKALSAELPDWKLLATQ